MTIIEIAKICTGKEKWWRGIKTVQMIRWVVFLTKFDGIINLSHHFLSAGKTRIKKKIWFLFKFLIEWQRWSIFHKFLFEAYGATHQVPLKSAKQRHTHYPSQYEKIKGERNIIFFLIGNKIRTHNLMVTIVCSLQLCHGLIIKPISLRPHWDGINDLQPHIAKKQKG